MKKPAIILISLLLSAGIASAGNVVMYTYDSAGLPTGRSAGSVYSEIYAFDGANGNLSNRTRTDQSSGQESFDYDGVNRLTGMGSRNVTYDAKGNITGIDGVGTMSYSPVPRNVSRAGGWAFITGYTDHFIHGIRSAGNHIGGRHNRLIHIQ